MTVYRPRPRLTLTRGASFEVARGAFRRQMDIVTRSVSEGRTRSQPVPSLTLRVTLARSASTSGATSKSASEVNIRPTRQSELPWFPSSSLGTSQLGAINGRTSVPKLELGNQGARTDGFGEYLPSEERPVAQRVPTRVSFLRAASTICATACLQAVLLPSSAFAEQ